MDKELNNIADDIIKDSFGSAAPSETSRVAPPSQTPSSTPSPTPSMSSARPAPTASQDPFASSRPATPRETFTAEVPTAEPTPRPTAPRPATMPTMNKANEYSRIKEQMSAAREASNLPDPSSIPAETNMPKHGLNKAIILLIILIPIIIVTAGVLIALFAQPSASDANNSENTAQPQYVDPRQTATVIDLSTFETEIQITEASHYILTGTTTFPVKINAPGGVTLYLDNVSITATGASAISNFSENKLTLVLDDDTENTLAVTAPETFTSIYSEGDLTIDGGTGILNVSGIKIAEGKHYDVTGNGINDTKGIIIEAKTETKAEGEATETPTDAPQAEPAAEPAPTEPNSTEGQPTEPVEPTAPVEPAEN